MADLFDNPWGSMGFEFVEFAQPTPGVLEGVFETLGFTRVAQHRSKDVALYRQGDINFIVNNEPASVASYFAAEHGPSACGMAFRVQGFAQGVRAGALARARSRWTCRPGRWSSSCRRSRASAACRCTSSTATATAPRSTTSTSSSSRASTVIPKGHGLQASSTTSPTTSIAAAWRTGRASTRRSSTSARSAISTSRASTPASPRRR